MRCSVFSNVLFNLKKTPKTWNNAIICLIPRRKDKLEYLKYWRPISRTIFNYLFLTRDLIKFSKQKKTPFYILQIDQEKAFDKTDRPFLFKTMEKLGFPKSYINFIEILYTENKSMISSNDFLSETISLFRGLRQGCPLSLPLYVIQGEVTT